MCLKVSCLESLNERNKANNNSNNNNKRHIVWKASGKSVFICSLHEKSHYL